MMRDSKAKEISGIMHTKKGYLAVHGEISLGEFRDLCGTSRKYAVQLLEFMDKKKITKMVGDKRVLIH